jgi:hypothetical protein
MNFAFSLRKDKELREGWLHQPYKIVDLWEIMTTIDLGQVLDAMRQLWNPVSLNDSSIYHPIEGYKVIKRSADVVFMAMQELGFPRLLTQARKLREVVYNNPVEHPPHRVDPRIRAMFPESNKFITFGLVPFSIWRNAIIEIRKGFSEELSSRLVMVLPLDRTSYFDGSKVSLSEKSKQRLPLVQKEMDEAAKCFAFRRYTSCAFHLMRGMELIVQKLGRKFNITNLHRKTWGQILNEIKPKIDAMPRNTAAQQAKQDRHNNWYALLHAVCNGIRNPTAHARITEIEMVYTEEELENLIGRVKDFINAFVELR